jgi:glycosyltransferase involved in cell wall biosynthesis
VVLGRARAGTYACASITCGLRIILDYRPALRQRTGVGEYVHEMARALAAEAAGSGDTVTAFSSSWKDRLTPDLLPGLPLVDAHIPVRILNFAWHWLEWPPIEHFAGSADIAHSAHPLLMPARDAIRVVTIHDLDFLEHPERTRREIRRDYPGLAAAHARRADLVVVSSSHTAAQVVDTFGVGVERVVLCPAGAPAWEPRQRNPRHGYFLFVGTLEPRKNIPRLLDAYERLLARVADAPPLRLAGPAPEAARDWLARLDAPPLHGRVSHLGYVEPAAKLELYAGAIALLIPSLYEGFGLTALEAMATGVPVIASRRGALPEVLGDAALYVDPEDDTSIARAMESLWSDPVARDHLAAAGRTRAAAFSWHTSATTLLGAYREAIARREARA